MHVILLERIGRLGQMGDVVRVKDGYLLVVSVLCERDYFYHHLASVGSGIGPAN